MSQTSINQAGFPIAVAGQVSQTREGMDIVSRFSGEASTRIGFGLAVKAGTSEHEVLLPTAANSVVQGVVKFGYNHTPGATGDLDQDSTPPGLKPNASIELMRQGTMWVQIDADTAIATPGETRAYCRFESDGGSNTKVGTFRHTDDTHVIDTRNQVVFVSGVRTAADGTKIAEVDVNFGIKP